MYWAVDGSLVMGRMRARGEKGLAAVRAEMGLIIRKKEKKMQGRKGEEDIAWMEKW